MINRHCIAVGLACVLAVSAAAPIATAQNLEPKQIVGSFYAEPNLPLPPERSGVYLARDLDQALRADSSALGRVATVGFDYRYGVQALNVSGLDLLQEVDNDQAKVIAVFKNFGHPESVNWTLCRRPDGGWRIADADSNTGRAAWSLRAMLRLPADRIRC